MASVSSSTSTTIEEEEKEKLSYPPNKSSTIWVSFCHRLIIIMDVESIYIWICLKHVIRFSNIHVSAKTQETFALDLNMILNSGFICKDDGYRPLNMSVCVCDCVFACMSCSRELCFVIWV